ncbi:SpoIIE family protein phosphatase, partial [Streptomyces sp. NPDC048483]|uniref:PP2C family protein-serine/threonine phosphatase n=1 Tax=Streptomyces sp. NPDC048483 TaxID=3154927 RepID=UPI003427F2D8
MSDPTPPMRAALSPPPGPRSAEIRRPAVAADEERELRESVAEAERQAGRMVSTYVDDDLALRQLRSRLAAVDVDDAAADGGCAGADGDGVGFHGFRQGEPAMFDLIPGLVAVVHGPDHRVAYVNRAYADLFGARPAGPPAREALPELAELGLLPLMDQALRSGRPRTVKARRVPDGVGRGRGHARYLTFTCTPTEHDGVLVFGADVTDQVEAAARLRADERRQREAAVTLQRSLLPQELEQPDDLRVAATYQPGGVDAAVGGDWYDVITLGAGRTALVIGDVMGRGVRAAAVMGQLRTAVRAYARLDLPPHEVLQLLDGLAAEMDASQIATCVYAVHDPNDDRLVYASAGQVPLLVRDADGTVRRAAEATGPPLGTGGWLHTSGSVPLGPGCSAVLYTDGLVERRDTDIDDGIEALERAFAGATGTPERVCDRLLRSLGVTAEHDDDVAVLVVQHPARTGHEAELFHNAALELHGGTEAAPRARAFASGVLASWR